MIEEYADRWAVVTGASSGIGAEYARVLASRGMHVILVARRKERLKELAAELFDKHGTRTEVISADLSQSEEVGRLFREIEQLDVPVEILVNNAGFGVVADIPNTSREDVLDLIRVNISALTDLTYRFLPSMIERRHGAILNIASVAGFQPVAYMGAYAASKSYVLHFSEALWAETRDHNVTVIAVCPGPTRTEFFDVAGVSGWLKKQSAQTPEQVVKSSLKAAERNRQFVITGWRNRLLSLLVRMAPRKIAVLESRKYFRPKPRNASSSHAVSTDEIAKDSESSAKSA
ncbi:SDR family NAD(P)-dependent oxidoreductase [Stratiformator vulcanicus]|uniref:SDR family NAD(P)-dependent oxidoreductase n=1 Tax=Stratiformator vulcanicus TaxID=2527980 RepID=UPI00119F06A0|nr:SDR family oxidoreductase [Stratiformator vulcanicus]